MHASSSNTAKPSAYHKLNEGLKLEGEQSKAHYKGRCWRASPRYAISSASVEAELNHLWYAFKRMELYLNERALGKLPKFAELTNREGLYQRVMETYLKYSAASLRDFDQEIRLGKSEKRFGLSAAMSRNIFLPLLSIVETELAVHQGTKKKRVKGKRTLIERQHSWKELQSGGCGDVYKALWEKQQPVAIKLNKRALRAKAFSYEIQVLRRLQGSPHILRYVAHGKCSSKNRTKQAYLATELAWRDLRDLMASWYAKKMHNWEFASVLSLSIQATAALCICHDRGVIHGDIKAENFFVTRDGRLILGDFGYASDKDLPGALKHYLRCVGTGEYLDPQVLVGKKKRDTSSDIFSLGMMFWELASGRMYLDECDSSDLNEEIQKQAFEPLPMDNVHPHFRNIIQDCCETEREKRPSARELLNKLYALAYTALDADNLWDWQPAYV